MESAERGEKASYLIKVSERKFTTASAERFVQSIKNECVDQFVVFGGHHLKYLTREYKDKYNAVNLIRGLKTGRLA